MKRKTVAVVDYGSGNLRSVSQAVQHVARTADVDVRVTSIAQEVFDAERVVLLRQLTEQGHAIGSLASLSMEQLRDVADTALGADAHAASAAPQASRPLRIVVIGAAMAQRLQRPGVWRAWATPPQVVAVFDSLSHALKSKASAGSGPVDVLLWQAASLQAQVPAELAVVQSMWAPGTVAVAYRFASTASREALANTGAVVAREPADDDALGAWLGSLAVGLVGGDRAPVATLGTSRAAGNPWLPEALQSGLAAPARRYDDTTLTAFAGLDSGIACDCPSHVAELLMQIAGFEAYSADCSHRSTADAELHAYLQRVAGAARLLFETALERVAEAEGWALA